MSDLDRLLDALPPWVLVGGKGGVGKTTCAAVLALRSAARGARTLLLSTDPAGSLADALGRPLDGSPRPIEARPGLDAFQLDAPAAREAFLARWRDVLVTILDRGTYLDQQDIAPLVDAALPGLDETMALLTLLDLDRDHPRDRVVLDTAPTGHTLRLLELPRTFAALLDLLDAMQGKHRFMVQALTRRYRADAADTFLEEMRTRLEALRRTLTDRARSAVVLVTRLEPVVVAETARYAEALADLGLTVAALVVNALPERPSSDTRSAATMLRDIAPDVPRYRVPELTSPPLGLEAIEGWGEAVRAGLGAGDSGPGAVGGGEALSPRAVAESRVPSPESRPVLPLTIVGGKGGVGKTTVACALGVSVATSERRVLVVSTDPAPSLADALDQQVGEEVVPVEGAPGLYAQQLDASAAFERFRERYRERVDAVFDSLMMGSLDASHDRRIARDLLSLAPPGIDELYALASLGVTLAESRYEAVVVDPAPTGHLLRLLEMPALALDWVHRLLRLMLKYKEVVGLGDAAQELLTFARRTRALDQLLHDETRAGVLVVALDEPLVRAETARLVSKVREMGVRVLGVLWNRSANPPSPLPTTPPVPHFEASVAVPPPRGVEALRQWAASWEALQSTVHG